MKVLDADFVRGFIRMADDGYAMGWHERNGGNLSYRIRENEIDMVRDDLKEGEWKKVGASVPDLAGEYFLITGTGKFFRNISLKPEECIGIIELDDCGENYRICWGFDENNAPTSELPSHLMNHEVKKKVSNGKNRVIYHAHPANVIALTFVLPLDDKTFTLKLWEMMSECAIVFPKGVGVVGWMVPGKRDIAVATSKVMKEYDAAIWAHHGIFVSGEDFDLAFGLLHTIEKAAEILVKVMSMKAEIRQTITSDEIRMIAKEFNVELREEFLD